MTKTKTRIALLGTVLMSAALLCGAARAQSYYDRYDTRTYDARAYDDRANETVSETIIVHPDYYDRVEKRQLMGRINGEVNPTEYSLSRPVNYSDLDLTRDADYLELKARVRDAAMDLCFELDARVPQLRGDRSADRECVRSATRNAMREVAELDR